MAEIAEVIPVIVDAGSTVILSAVALFHSISLVRLSSRRNDCRFKGGDND